MATPYTNDQIPRTESAAALGRLLADSYLRYLAVAEAQGDVATADLATWRVAQHDQVAWMLGSLLQGSKSRGDAAMQTAG